MFEICISLCILHTYGVNVEFHGDLFKDNKRLAVLLCNRKEVSVFSKLSFLIQRDLSKIIYHIMRKIARVLLPYRTLGTIHYRIYSKYSEIGVILCDLN